MSQNTLKPRSQVAVEDTWDLGSLFPNDAEWEKAFEQWQSQIPGYASYKGKLGEAEQLLACLQFDTQTERTGERLGTYAFLKETEDVSNSTYQGMKARYMGIAAQAAEAASYIRPEILSLPDETLQKLLADSRLSEYHLLLKRLVRYKPHTLSPAEERLLALQMETNQTPRNVFDQLVDADFQFGELEIEAGKKITLSHGTFLMCLENPNRDVRRQAFQQYYGEYQRHANTLAACLAGSIKQDVYQARVRNFSSARGAALFPDNVPETVYDQLIAAVRGSLPAVHRYYELRQRAMKLDAIHFYDIYTPILPDVSMERNWGEAVEVVLEALRPLGADYHNTLASGLRGRWCDRYENKGKHSGAFSSGCYDSDPYILMNYRAEVPDHVFTLAHEAGHSMHTHLSKKQSYPYAGYSIFVAEVASTFNEQLLGKYLIQFARSDKEKAYYINREIDDIRRTIIRQTMFAEFEKITHAQAEANEPLTLDGLRATYQELLQAYFGPKFTLDESLSLEGLRIPHFYRAFYVYKYATGLSAAIALAERVTRGGSAELADYLGFLSAGSSLEPLEVLKKAGVDMSTPAPVQSALAKLNYLVDELEQVLTRLGSL